MKRYAAELIGTFALVFCGTGAIVINEHTHGVIGNAGIAATFGLVVMAMILVFGQTSGAHLNPAVTLGFVALKLFPAKQALPYLLAQILGALAASLLLKFLFPENLRLGVTLPAGSGMQSLILECVLTFLLMLTILFTSQGTPGVRQLAPLAIGAVVCLEALFAGPICGASMNPARSIGPALVSQHTESLWIYLVAPLTGSLSGCLAYKILGLPSS